MQISVKRNHPKNLIKSIATRPENTLACAINFFGEAMRCITILIILSCLFIYSIPSMAAEQYTDPRELAISATLDLWRLGDYDKLFESLSHRNSTTKESFVSQLKDAELRPECCHKKLNNFRLLSEKKTTAKVYARVGLEGAGSAEYPKSREFTLDLENGTWKMRLADIKSLSGMTKKKKYRPYKAKKY